MDYIYIYFIQKRKTIKKSIASSKVDFVDLNALLRLYLHKTRVFGLFSINHARVNLSISYQCRCSISPRTMTCDIYSHGGETNAVGSEEKPRRAKSWTGGGGEIWYLYPIKYNGRDIILYSIVFIMFMRIKLPRILYFIIY